jgi:hypothetical protein
MKPHRIPLYDFPDVVLHAPESTVKGHPQYAAAKGGDDVAAVALVSEFIGERAVEQLGSLPRGRSLELVPIHALESQGVNEIPATLAAELSRRLGLPVNRAVVQLNSVGHTGADGFTRLANQALFDGPIQSGRAYLIVDDFVGQGGTLANLIGFIRSQGGEVLGATVLTGKPYSAKLAPDEAQIRALRAKHGAELEEWWRQRFGFGFECLTRSEARYLENTPDADAVRSRIAAAGSADGAGSI